MIDKTKVGKIIALLRGKLGYSQAVFAEKLNVTPQAVSKWETGQTLPELDVLLNISWMCRISINEILEADEIYYDPLNNINRELYRMNGILVCPKCGQNLHLNVSSGVMCYECVNEHIFSVDDGVIYFNTREIPGEEWSLWLRNYEHYLSEAESPELLRYSEGDFPYKEIMWREIEKLRPNTIVDFACGTGSGIKYIAKRINWRCTVILTDLSYRILSWNRKYFSEKINNPYVDFVYLACDCSNIPLRDNSVDLVFSNFGFESTQDKSAKAFIESHRILKPGGHAVYNMSLIENRKSENSKNWIDLLLTLGVFTENIKLLDITQWLAVCASTGFTQSASYKVYGEMPAPDTKAFPFENQILRWMACYVFVSQK